MTARRRRERPSDWVLALNASRSAKKLRRTFPTATEFTHVGADKAHFQHPQIESIKEKNADNHVPSDEEILKNHATEMEEQQPRHCVVSGAGDNFLPALENNGDGIVDLTGSGEGERESQTAPCTTQRENHTADKDHFTGQSLPLAYPEQSPLSPDLDDRLDCPTEQTTGNQGDVPSCLGCLDGTINIEHTCQRANDASYNERRPDMMALSARSQKWKFRLNLTALIAVVGSVRFTVHQYNYTRDLLEDVSANPEDHWPPYSKTQIHWKDIIKNCLPDSHVVCLGKVGATNTAREAQDPALEPQHDDEESDHMPVETERVRIFLPSAWARLDVCTSVTFDDMYSDATDKELNSINMYPIVRDRNSVTSACDSVFIGRRGECVPCGPGSEIEVKVLREKPQMRAHYHFRSEDDSYTFSAVVAATWCVGATRSATQSFERALNQCALSECEQQIAHHFSVADSRPDDSNVASPISHMLPGDICTILSPHSTSSSAQNSEYRAVLVHRFWRFEDGIPSIFICWVKISPNTPITIMNKATFSHVVKELNLLRLSNRTTQLRTHHASRGHLANGTPYVVYRILLYCDDFQRSSQHYPRGSAGGCYFLPLSLPPEKRRTISAVRVISLTPPGVSTNQVLQYIINDLVHATTFGIDGHTPDGSPIKIFIEVVGFVGDFPAAAATIDVLGHVSRAPCTLCTFRRQHASVAEGSRYGYTTDVHAGNSSFLRHAERHFSLRKAGMSAHDANFLGMVDSERIKFMRSLSTRLTRETSHSFSFPRKS